MIDTHCHLNDSKFADDFKQVVANFLSAGVDKAICVGWDYNSSVKAKELSATFPQVYYSIGVHPDECGEFDLKKIENLVKSALKEKNTKLVAIGEIGLDYFHNTENKDEQKRVFSLQIELAKKYHLPIIIHCRDAYGDTLEILKSHLPIDNGVVFHCFSGSLEYAEILVRLGFKISFTGTVTYKNATNVQNVAKNIPLDSIMFETDSPYLTPVPHRGERNEPKFVLDVAKFVANLRELDYDELIKITDKNAMKFFKLK